MHVRFRQVRNAGQARNCTKLPIRWNPVIQKEKGPTSGPFSGVILLPVGLADLMTGTLRRFALVVNWEMWGAG